MGRVKPTEKSSSKEKKEKSGSKGVVVKSAKGVKAKETPTVANFLEDELVSPPRSKKIPKTSISEVPELSDINPSTGVPSTKGDKRKKSAARSEESIPKPSKGGEDMASSKVSSSKKRAREEPETATKSATKRKKLELSGGKAAQTPAPSKKKAEKEFSETSGDSEDDIAEVEEAEQEDEEVYLHGFSTDEDSSDDEEIMDQDPLEVKSLPSKAKDDAEVKRRLDAAKKKPTTDRGILYIGRIPHGFYEEQMKDYFSQFGNTGRSKHYGFIEFDSSSVAKIVSETMDNYLLAGHLLQCKLIATEQLHPDLWVGSNKKWKRIPKGRIARLAHNKTRTPAQQTRAEERLLKRQAEKDAKLKAAGISYSLSKVGYTRISA